MEIDANEVVRNLSLQLAQKSIEVATLQAQVAKLQKMEDDIPTKE